MKYDLANPGVTAVIPGTDNPAHMLDNLGAARGELPDADLLENSADGMDQTPVIDPSEPEPIPRCEMDQTRPW